MAASREEASRIRQEIFHGSEELISRATSKAIELSESNPGAAESNLSARIRLAAEVGCLRRHLRMVCSQRDMALDELQKMADDGVCNSYMDKLPRLEREFGIYVGVEA